MSRMESSGDDGGKGIFIRMREIKEKKEYFINTLALSLDVCVSWESVNVTGNYLNKLSAEVIAASFLTALMVTLSPMCSHHFCQTL